MKIESIWLCRWPEDRAAERSMGKSPLLAAPYGAQTLWGVVFGDTDIVPGTKVGTQRGAARVRPLYIDSVWAWTQARWSALRNPLFG